MTRCGWALCLRSAGNGQEYVAKALALLAVQRSYQVLYREAHQLIEDIAEARELGSSGRTAVT